MVSDLTTDLAHHWDWKSVLSSGRWFFWSCLCSLKCSVVSYGMDGDRLAWHAHMDSNLSEGQHGLVMVSVTRDRSEAF